MYRGHAAPALCGLQDAKYQDISSHSNVIVERLRASVFNQSISTMKLRIRLDDRLIDTVHMVRHSFVYDLLSPYMHANEPTDEMENLKKLNAISFNVDLLIAIQREARFLQNVEKCHFDLYEEQIVRNAIRRYELYWLPLQARYHDVNIQPPIDVHWIWHTHMLSPLNYRKDCQNIAGVIIDHAFPDYTDSAENKTNLVVWERFTRNSEPFDYRAVLSVPQYSDYEQKSKYDIASAVQRQRSFNYHVSLPHYNSVKFLTESVERYKRFLFLMQKYPGEFFTPCYDFDLVWHAHQVHPVIYAKDTLNIVGRVLDHNDSVDDRPHGTQLKREQNNTKLRWQATFPNNPLWRRGSMYRGHAAPALCGLQDAKYQDISSHSNVIVERLRASGFNQSISTMKLRIRLDDRLIDTVHMTKLESCKGEYEWPTNGKVGNIFIEVAIEKGKNLLLKPKLDGNRHSTEIGQLAYSTLVPPEGQQQKLSTVHMRDRKLNEPTDANIELTSRIVPCIQKLRLLPDTFTKRTLKIGNQFYDLCYAAALNKPDYGQSMDVFMANHRISISSDKYMSYVSPCHVHYTRVIHAAQYLLSVVLVYDHADRLLTMSHLVGPDTLPPIGLIEHNNMPELSSKDERAMIIMNRKGDYSLVRGKWIGFKRRVPGHRGYGGKAGSAGNLHLDLFNLSNRNVPIISMTLPRRHRRNDLWIDLGQTQSNENGDISTRSDNVAEEIATLFSIMNVFVLCNPDKVRISANPRHKSRGHNCYNWELARACGYGDTIVETPSNRYFVQRAQQHGESSTSGSSGYHSGDSTNWFLFGVAGMSMGSGCGATGGDVMGGDVGACCACHGGCTGGCGAGCGGGGCGASCDGGGCDGGGCDGGCGGCGGCD